MTSPPFGRLRGTRALPRLICPLLPLLLLALSTTTAFALAIHGRWADLSPLWTQCGGSAATGHRLSTPVCFAVSFFQAALNSQRGRLEKAVIVGLLAGLATVTAAESARARSTRDGRHDQQQQQYLMSGENNTTGSTTSNDGDKNSSNSTLSAKIVENPTLPWLLYNLALGALSWQLIIIPASIIQETVRLRRQQQRMDAQPRRTLTTATLTPLPGGGSGSEKIIENNLNDFVSVDGPPSANYLSIPFSITLGLLLPSTLMLTTTTTTTSQTVIILIWLVFPVWVFLIEQVVRSALSSLSSSSSSTCLTRSSCSSSGPARLTMMIWAVPVLYSAVAHVLLIADVLRLFDTSPFPFSSSSSNPVGPSSPSSPPPAAASHSALLLLEIDHAAIFIAYLYWLLVTTSPSPSTSAHHDRPRARARALTTVILSTLLLGPGAGVCLGWSCRDGGYDRHGQDGPMGGGGEAGIVQLGAPPPPRRRARRATTGNFFGGPDA